MLLIIGASTVVAGDPTVERRTVDGGGVMFSIGGDFELSGTIGQPDAGALITDPYELTGGFWFPVAPGDCNIDGGVNLLDFGDFELCLLGPEVGPLEIACVCLDLDRDEDIDLSDIALFQQGFSGG